MFVVDGYEDVYQTQASNCKHAICTRMENDEEILCDFDPDWHDEYCGVVLSSLMIMMAEPLSDKEITNLAAYLSNVQKK